MGIETLSAIIGHVSSSTTLNAYAHVTDRMRQSAAAKIDRDHCQGGATARNGRKEKARPHHLPGNQGQVPQAGHRLRLADRDHLWEGRYSPKINGKRLTRNVYAQTEAECEAKLAEMIVEMKEEIARLRQGRQVVAGKGS